MATLHIPTVPNKTRVGHPVHLQFYQIAIGKQWKYNLLCMCNLVINNI